MNGGAYGGTKKQNAATFRKDIASYNPQTEFFQRIVRACDFKRFKDKGKIFLLDGMSGPGRLGKDLKKAFEEEQVKGVSFIVVFNDMRKEPLAKLQSEGFATIESDIRKIGLTNFFHIVAVRYGLKDLPKGHADVALYSLYGSLKHGGRIVIPDMVAYTTAGQEGVIAVHSAKQELSGRKREREGVCFIPKEKEWRTLLNEAGFKKVHIIFKGTSDVDTQNWKGQFAPDVDDASGIAQMNEVIRKVCSTNKTFEKEFQVKFEGEKVLLKFPIMVAVAEKA